MLLFTGNSFITSFSRYKMKNECVPRTIFDQLHFVSLFKFWSMLHHVWLGWFENKKYYFMLLYTFLTFFCFLLWNLSFYHFLFFFDNVSNFLNIILTNKKQALVIINHLWNCLEWMLQRCWYYAPINKVNNWYSVTHQYQTF